MSPRPSHRQWTGFRSHTQQAAFTLIELLVSLSLFAVLSIIAYSTLQSVLDASQRSNAQAERLIALQTLFTVMARDIEQVIYREIRDTFGDKQPALKGTINAIEFSRTGRRNPAGFTRSNLQRITYLLEDETVKRRAWGVIDRAQDSNYQEGLLLDEIEAIEIRYLDEQFKWKNQWPIPDVNGTAPPGLPNAIEFSVENKKLGRITRLFRIPQGFNVKLQKNAGNT